jgi:hypothetical protein
LSVESASHTHFLPTLVVLSFNKVGERVWDANVEGTPIDDIDLVKLANGTAFTAVTIKTNVVCVDGFITIKLLNNMPVNDFPTLGAIEIKQLN